MNNNFCYHPWVGLDITTQGDFRPCCKYNKGLAKNLKDYVNSEELKQLQQDFLNGLAPSGCSRCWEDEAAGIQSKRQIDFKHVFNETAPNLDKFKVLSLPFGNTCNLACRTCSSFASSKWSHHENKIKNVISVPKIFKHQKFYKDHNFIDNIKSISDDLIDITFPGGEPFITGIDEHLDYLDFLIKNNTQNISLTYITNVTTFPTEEFWTRWKNFKHVNIQMSIDGTNERFEYIRWPADWNICYTNIKKYQEAKTQNPNLQLSISHTVSVFNIFYLPEFFVWCLKEKLPEPYIGMVESPLHYNIQVLPEEIKYKIKSKLTMSKFNGVVNFLMSKNVAGFDLTKDWIKTVDQQRTQEFGTVFPELKEFFL